MRCTRADKSRWERKAARCNLTLSEYVRAHMNGEPLRVVAVADPDLLGELKRHGTNLNQMMHAINAGYFVKPTRVEQTIETLQALYRREIDRG